MAHLIQQETDETVSWLFFFTVSALLHVSRKEFISNKAVKEKIKISSLLCREKICLGSLKIQALFKYVELHTVVAQENCGTTSLSLERFFHFFVFLFP